MQNAKTFGKCVTCHRDILLIKHHLIPKKDRNKKNNPDAMMTLIAWVSKCKKGIK